LYFWGIYEMGFPEGSNMKAPRDSEFPFGAFFLRLSSDDWKTSLAGGGRK
jgi:hypothetical protein